MLTPGARLGPYEVVSSLGAGGMGVVYRARDPRLDRHVAIKLLPAATAGDPHARERLRREAMAVAAVDHPYICKIFEIGEDGDALFLVMEYIVGTTLHQRLLEGRMPLPEIFRVAGEIAEALQDAHARGFVHRDLKPANIMLTEQGHVKVMDFGLAKRIEELASQDGATREVGGQLTAHGAIVGTPDYMSPEQVRGLPLDTRSDLFSFGAILVEMITGRHPFRQRSTIETFSAVLRESPVLTDDVPPRLRPVLERLLAKEVGERYQSIPRLNPTFAPAFSGLSDAYLWAGYNEGFLTASDARPKARAAAEKAIQLDDNSAEAHASVATFKVFYEFDWAGMEREFRRSFSLNPNYAFAHDQFGLGLAFLGRFDEAMAEGRRAAELDPLSPQIPLDNSIAYMFQGNYEAARQRAKRAEELDPTFFFPQFEYGWVAIEAGKFADAIAPIKKAKGLGAPAFVNAWLAYAYAASGDRGQAMTEVEELKKVSLRGEVTPFNLAVVELGLGNRQRAIEYLERAYASDSQWMGWLNKDRMFDPLRSEPRFVALMKKLKFTP